LAATFKEFGELIQLVIVVALEPLVLVPAKRRACILPASDNNPLPLMSLTLRVQGEAGKVPVSAPVSHPPPVKLLEAE